MKIVIGGQFRFRPEAVDALRPAMEAMTIATRAEDGCETYAYSEDVLDPGLIRVFEIWRDQAALDAHGAAPHMAVWQAARNKLGVSERRVIAYEVASERDL